MRFEVEDVTHTSATSEDEDRFRALQETDERLMAHIEELRRCDADVLTRIAAVELLSREQTLSSFLRSMMSRKFLLTVLGALSAVVAALAGYLPPEWAGGIAAALSALYVLVQGYADASERKAVAEAVTKA